MQLAPDFSFRPLPQVENLVHFPFPEITNPLGPLADLIGTWTGTGFNTIWRPHFPKQQQDRFLELNLTQETLEFDPISGPIPNRGLLQQDINMYGVHYLQQIKDSSNNAGLHIEPGIWAVVPDTSDPKVPKSVVRMASIPHGTTMIAQGVAPNVETPGKPTFVESNLIPFAIGGTAPPNSAFPQAEHTFPELNLSIPSNFRVPPNQVASITQAMVENPNSVLQAAIAQQNIEKFTTLVISSTPKPVLGGGTANTAFLQGATDGPNAVAAQVDAVFWIEWVKAAQGPDFLQLQYTQRVLLNFNGLSWPHVSVATLRKKVPVSVSVQYLDPEIPVGLLKEVKPQAT